MGRYWDGMSTPDALAWLMQWYLAQCNQDWEHEFGITIATLDNPGWGGPHDLGRFISTFRTWAER
jgi:hypothetical protein